MTFGYYPFGLKQKGYNNTVNGGNSLAQNWKYSGKELNQDLGIEWYDFGARNYDASLGRWMNIDPLAEDYESWTPYQYTYNNPIFFVDPDGQRIIINYGEDQTQEYAYQENRDYDAIDDDFLRSSLQALDKWH